MKLLQIKSRLLAVSRGLNLEAISYQLSTLIIFLYGRDSYRLKQNLDKIIAEYQKKSSGVSLAVLDFNLNAENNPRRQLEKLADLIKTTSFFNEKRLIVLKAAFLVSKEVANLVRNWG